MAPDPGPRELQRVVAFTDAAVAIALTLLVLPLVDIAHEGAGTPLVTLWDQHVDDVLAFVISFFVVALFWRAHRRVMEVAERHDEPLLTLNMFWLLGVVVLPVPTAVLTFGDGDGHGPVVLYLANLCFVSALTTALSAWVATHPRLRRGPLPVPVWRWLLPGAAATASIAVVIGLAVVWGAEALYVLIVMPLVGRGTRGLVRHG